MDEKDGPTDARTHTHPRGEKGKEREREGEAWRRRNREREREEPIIALPWQNHGAHSQIRITARVFAQGDRSIAAIFLPFEVRRIDFFKFICQSFTKFSKYFFHRCRVSSSRQRKRNKASESVKTLSFESQKILGKSNEDRAIHDV